MAELAAPCTVAPNCSVWFWPSVADRGDSVTKIEVGGGGCGCRLMTAVSDLVASAALVAVTRTACVVAMVAGAVYLPAESMDPADGAMDQTTAVLAVNCCD